MFGLVGYTKILSYIDYFECIIKSLTKTAGAY